MGVGICVKKLNVQAFSRALWECTNNEVMITKADMLGKQIRSVGGVYVSLNIYLVADIIILGEWSGDGYPSYLP